MNTLSEKMSALAAAGHERAQELLEKAAALDAASDQDNMKKLLGCWARARRVWCECTGEDLV